MFLFFANEKSSGQVWLGTFFFEKDLPCLLRKQISLGTDSRHNKLGLQA
jgi:hypothetical protein